MSKRVRYHSAGSLIKTRSTATRETWKGDAQHEITEEERTKSALALQQPV
jgi:hypothetical protein